MKESTGSLREVRARILTQPQRPWCEEAATCLFPVCLSHCAASDGGARGRVLGDQAGSCAFDSQGCKAVFCCGFCRLPSLAPQRCRGAAGRRIPPPGAEREQPGSSSAAGEPLWVPVCPAPQEHTRSVRPTGHREGQRVRTHVLTAPGAHYCIAFLSNSEIIRENYRGSGVSVQCFDQSNLLSLTFFRNHQHD